MDDELERVLYEAEEFLLQKLRSGFAGIFNGGRRARQGLQEALRRLRRAGFLMAGMLAVLAAASLFVDFSFLTWIAAVSAALLFASLSLFRPARQPSARVAAVVQTTRLDELAARAAEVLRTRRSDFPEPALAAADAAVFRLRELAPLLGQLDPNATLAGDARRLICEHLPRLVDAYFDLPPRARGRRSESSQRLAGSLQIIADELGNMLEQCGRDRSLSFETERRFIESRYGEDGGLKRS